MNVNTEFKNLENIIKNEKNSEYSESIELTEKLLNYIWDNENEDRLKLLIKLIDLSIIIKNYPKRIIKKGTKSQTGTQFDASIMCLLCYKYVKFTNVKIVPVLSKVDKNEPLQSKLHSPENQNLWILKNMRWKSTNVGRSSRRNNCDRKIISFNFSANFTIKSFVSTVNKYLYSDTVVIIVHSNQEIESLLTLFWDDYYRIGEELISLEFSCKNESKFDELIENISDFFWKETNRFLTSNNKAYLLEKIRKIFSKSETISRDEFMKTTMPNFKISFGQWIMSIIKMLKIPTLEKLWIDNCIEGFIGKDVNNILLQSGSFLLRFSERHAALGVVIKTENETEPWEPYLESQLRVSNLANLLCEYPQLTHLRLSNGMFLPCNAALAQHMNPIPIDDGYTKRGGNETFVDSESSNFKYFQLCDLDNDSLELRSNVDIEMDEKLDLNDIMRSCDDILLNDFKS